MFDYRETAPAAVMRDTFVEDRSTGTTTRRVGVPGTVRGLELAHKKFGKLPWKDSARSPRFDLADEGFALDAPMAKSLNDALKRKGGSDEFHRVFGKRRQAPWHVGDRLVQKDLAKTLRRSPSGGADAFYTGELADLLVAEMKAGGGFITPRGPRRLSGQRAQADPRQLSRLRCLRSAAAEFRRHRRRRNAEHRSRTSTWESWARTRPSRCICSRRSCGELSSIARNSWAIRTSCAIPSISPPRITPRNSPPRST